MTTISPDEFGRFRSELANNQEALAALDVIEQCEGNLEDAAQVILLEAGEEEVQSDLFDKLIRYCRNVACQEDMKEELPVLVAAVTEYLAAGSGFPPGLATPFSIFVIKKTLKKFCL